MIMDPRATHLQTNIAEWEVTAANLPEKTPEQQNRKARILEAIEGDRAELEYLTATAGPEPTIEDRAEELAKQNLDQELVEIAATEKLKALRIAHPAIDTSDLKATTSE